MVSETACRDCYEADPLCPFIVITALYMNQLNSVLLFTKHATAPASSSLLSQSWYIKPYYGVGVLVFKHICNVTED